MRGVLLVGGAGWVLFLAFVLAAGVPAGTAVAEAAPAVPRVALAEQRAVVEAYRRFRRDQPSRFARQARRVPDESVFAPAMAYWQAILELRRGRPAEAIAYMAEGESPYFAFLARRQLLVHFARHKEWAAFGDYAGGGGECAVALDAMVREEARAAVAMRTLWEADMKMNESLCLSLYRYAYREGALEAEDVWVKVRGLAGQRRLGPVRRLLRTFPKFVSYTRVRRVVRGARRYIRSRHPLKTRAERELVMIAAMVTARGHPKTALARWGRFSQYFTEAQNDHVYTHLAMWAARWHRADALALYEKTSGRYDTEETRGWRVRAAMRAGEWALVRDGIDAMPLEERNLSAWRYWRAEAMGRLTGEEARLAALGELAAEEDDFYGLLAREETGAPLMASGEAAAGGRVEGDFAIALAARDAGMTSLGWAIWRYSSRRDDVPDEVRLAAAAAAAGTGWHFGAIDAASRARDAAAAHALRFPFPFYDAVKPQADKRGLDLAFVYALIHQESRFMPAAVSPARARGLMQVVPSTARQVARQHGYSRYRLSRLTRVDTNLVIGTSYLRRLARRWDGAPAKVAAGYNAGPARVRRWYSVSDDLLVAIENIPLTETRLYVKHLLANRVHYSARLGREVPSMRDMIHQPVHRAVG